MRWWAPWCLRGLHPGLPLSGRNTTQHVEGPARRCCKVTLAHGVLQHDWQRGGVVAHPAFQHVHVLGVGALRFLDARQPFHGFLSVGTETIAQALLVATESVFPSAFWPPSPFLQRDHRQYELCRSEPLPPSRSCPPSRLHSSRLLEELRRARWLLSGKRPQQNPAPQGADLP